MNLIDLLKAKKQQEQNIEFAPLQPVQQEPTMQPILLNDDGTEIKEPVINYASEKTVKPTKNGLSLYERLMGVQATPTDAVNEGEMSATISENPRRGGILRDIAGGYRENRDNAISLDNFGQNTLEDGRKKGFAYRLGEGLGSLSRFGQSPLGRGLIVGGLVGATGGNPLEMLAYGATTGANNQMYRNNDRIYRNDLIQSAKQQLMSSPEFNTLTDAEQQQVMQNAKMTEGYNALTEEELQQALLENGNKPLTEEQKQALLGAKQDRLLSEAQNSYLTNKQQNALKGIENDYNGLRGYITNDTYNNLMRSQQIRDNYAYRNMMLNNQVEQNKIMNQLRKDQFDATKAQQEFNRKMAIANLEDKKEARANQNYWNGMNYGLKVNELNLKADEKVQKEFEKQKETQDLVGQLNTLMDLHGKLPQNFAPKGSKMITAGATGALNKLGLRSNDMSAFDGTSNILTNMIARKIGGEKGVLTDKDFDRARAMTPQITDTPQQARAKYNSIMKLIGVSSTPSKSAKSDPLGIRK